MTLLRAPAPRPCESCPYRRDVPSGVWAPEEYEKLRGYDNETAYQPPGVFTCHQTERDSTRARVCAGWAGCHADNPRGHELMALRFAIPYGVLSVEDAEATDAYRTDVPLFASAAEAADHGMAEVDAIGPQAERVVQRIIRKRPDVQLRSGTPRRRALLTATGDGVDDNLIFDDEDGGE